MIIMIGMTQDVKLWRCRSRGVQYLCLLFITASKRSLRQGNVFTRICHSVPGRHAPCHACPPAMYTPLPCMPPATHTPRRHGQWAGSTHPTGMHPCCLYFCVCLPDISTVMTTTNSSPPPKTPTHPAPLFHQYHHHETSGHKKGGSVIFTSRAPFEQQSSNDTWSTNINACR